jgi:hypothetical protein
MSLLRDDKRNMTICLSLAIILVALGQSLGAEMITHSSSSPTLLINNQNSPRSNEQSISSKLTETRHLLKSLFLDWNLGGESDMKGKVRELIFHMSTQPKRQSKQLKMEFRLL